MRKFFIYILLLCLSFPSMAQKGKTKPTGGKSDGPASIQIDFSKLKLPIINANTFDIPFYPKSFGKMLASTPNAVIKTYSITGLPVWIEGNLMNVSKINRQDIRSTAIDFLSINQKNFGIQNAAKEFKITKIASDDAATSHIKMQQEYKGIEVWNAEVMIHLRDGIPYLFNGRYIPTPSYVNTLPDITLNQAMEIVKKLYPIPDYSSQQLSLIGNNPLSGRLVIYTQIDKNEKGQLAYLIDIHPTLISKITLFVDAHNGKVIDEIKSYCALDYRHSDTNTSCTHLSDFINNTQVSQTTNFSPLDGPATATALDLNNVSRQIHTYQLNGNYFLLDASRQMFAGGNLPDDPKGAIWTIDAQGGSPENNNFNLVQLTSSNNSWNNKKAVSAHYNGGVAYEYFKNTFNRNSINGSGGTIISIINVNNSDGSNMDNAFWNGYAMFYGNGNQAFKPLAGALDVAGHEMSHGVIQATANLTYQGESGAMNESFADVFGALIDRDDYKIGEDVVLPGVFAGGALRDMSNPHNGGSSLNDQGWQPNHMNEKYTGSQDNGGVHINSGILNFAFYKIASKLGKDDAEKLYYAALTKYLTKSSQFIDCRNAVIQAAKDKYGANSPNIAQIENSFSEVGIGSGNGTTQPPDYGSNPGQDYILFTDPDFNQINLANVTTGEVNTLDFNGGLASKISVSDDGTLAVFIGKDKAMYYIQFDWSAGNYNIGLLDNSNQWRNVALSKDGLRLAGLLDTEEPYIYVFDLAGNTSNAFELYNPTTGDGNIFTSDVQYADAMEFDHSGEFLMYDALSSLGFFGAEFWDIGFLHVWNNNSKTYGDGTIEKLFSSLPDGVNVGNAVFSKNSPNVIAFDYFENGNNEVYELLAGNIETGELNVIYENNVLSYPCFSKDDKYLIFNALDNSNTDIIAAQQLNANKISPSGNPFVLINNSTLGTWFANGKRDLNDVISQNILTDNVNIFPNPATSNVNIQWISQSKMPGKINIYDTKGKKLVSRPVNLKNGKNQFNLNTSQLQPGIYLIEIQRDNLSKTIKIVKE
ncbi:MAG: M4 family metallopeptidase [Saprospiraceae bacterium]|nr:M4 family metallopeptidase [Saprospiraceae bacterium]